MTADVVAPVPSGAVRRADQRLQLLVDSACGALNKITEVVAELKASDAHIELGFTSWTEYLAARLEPLRIRLTGDERRELVSSLAQSGMGTRAIAKATGVGKSTVARDLAGVPDGTPEREVTGTDGKTYVVPATTSSTVKRNRKPLPDAYWNAMFELQKAAERVERLHADDRFSSNRQGLHDKYWRAMSAIESLVSSMGEDLNDHRCECGERVGPNQVFASTCPECRGDGR